MSMETILIFLAVTAACARPIGTGASRPPAAKTKPDVRQLGPEDRILIRPFLYFTYRYVIRLGFLDGKEGAIFHFLQAFWFRLLVDINVDQLRREEVRS